MRFLPKTLPLLWLERILGASCSILKSILSLSLSFLFFCNHTLTTSPCFRSKKMFGFSISLILINLVSILERADENLLPAVYKEVSAAFNAGPTDLGYLTFMMNFLKSIASPLAGVLAFHYDRPAVLAIGTAFWALSTGAVGVSQYFGQVAFWRAVNGFGLAIVIPALQSFIADSYKDGTRGAGFGLLALIGSVGGIGGSVLATVVAEGIIMVCQDGGLHLYRLHL